VNPPLGHSKAAPAKTNAKPLPTKQPVPKTEGIQPSTVPPAASTPPAPRQP